VTWSAQPTICGQHSETATDWGQRDARAAQRVASVGNRAPPHGARLARHCGNPANIAASGSEQSNSGSRAAVLGQAGAPLSWTRERADTFFVCERVRKAAAHKRQPQRAQRAI